MIHIQPPKKPNWSLYQNKDKYIIFAAGSIEQGIATMWQDKLIERLNPFGRNIVLLNPRRDNWNAEEEQSIDNPVFKEQVTWELDGIENSHLVVFYFDPKTKSPITLLELGLVAGLGYYGPDVVVCCPHGFWRRGNIEIVCERSKFPLYHRFADLVSDIKNKVTAHENQNSF